MAKFGSRPQQAPTPKAAPLAKPDALPPHPLSGAAWGAYAIRYWNSVWESDARLYWEGPDIILLERCLFMVEQISMGVSSVATLAELRRTEESLFLSPGSRQRSRISLAAPADEVGDLERRRQEREALLAEG